MERTYMDKIAVLVVIALLILGSCYKMVGKVKGTNTPLLETLRAIYLLLFALLLMIFGVYIGIL